GVAVDGGGNVLLTGYVRDAADFGGGPLTSTYGGITLFLAKFSASGAHLWSKSFSNTGVAIGYGIAADGAGNVAVTGSFTGRINFGGGDLTSAGGHDAFVASFSPDGGHRWSKRFGSTSFDYGYGVAIDGAGNVLSTGYFQNSADFGGGPLTSAGRQDAFVLSLGP